MNEEVNMNEILAHIAQANIDRFVAAAGSRVKGISSVARSQFKTTYRPYLKRLIDRHSKAKSFLFGAEPTPLYEFFVPLDISTDKRVIKKAEIGQIAAVSKHTVITGTGGCGKTILMRHLLVSCIRTNERVPTFIELRLLDERTLDIRDALLQSLQLYGLRIDDAFMESALSSGHLCLLFDGFDELDQPLRKMVVQQIEYLATRYPDNWIILTSRPDSELHSLANFVHFRIDPLTLERAVELVSKLPVEDALKAKFIDDLERDLYTRHQTFLSNPLLLSIMLLTYQDAAHIPSKVNIFYEQAFEALFQKHDARKGGYTRQRRSSLDMQDFATAFSAFCLLTYDSRQFRFSRISALDSLARAQSLCQVMYDSEDLLDDSIQAVCLLIEDGLDISFTHRSFQEYFAARFIAHCSDAGKKILIERFSPNLESDTVLHLLWEMDRRSVEANYIVPRIERLRADIGVRGRVGITHFLSYIKRVYNSFGIVMRNHESIVITSAEIRDVETFILVRFLRRHYRDEFSPALPEGELSAERLVLAQQLFPELITEQGDAPEMVEIHVSGLTTRSPLIRFMFGGSTEFGIIEFGPDELRDLLSIGNKISRRHAIENELLGQLLSTRGSKATRNRGNTRLYLPRRKAN